MSKLTSVEWLLKELYTEMNLSGDGRVLDEILEQAKEMHKQEIIKAFEYGVSEGVLTDINYTNCTEEAEFYYNETYQSVDTNEMIDHIGDVNEMVDVPQQNDVNQELSEVVKNESYDVREDDVEKLQQDAWDNYEHEEGNLYSTTFRNAFKLGYNKAKENTYTEEQVREAIENTLDSIPFISKKPCADSIIKSLKQHK